MHSWLVLVLALPPAMVAAEEGRWWPVQVLPKALVRTENWQRFSAPNGAYQMLVQSVAGLAAKAVNQGRGDELVWVGTDHADLEHWYDRLLARRPQLQVRGVLRPWELVDRYVQQGIIKGYIVYAWDSSAGALCTFRPGMDCSVNVATSLAGPFGRDCGRAELGERGQGTRSENALGRSRQDPGVVFCDLPASVQPPYAVRPGSQNRPGPRFGDCPAGVRRLRPGRASSGGNGVARTAFADPRLERWRRRVPGDAIVEHLRPCPDGNQLVHQPAGPDGGHRAGGTRPK